VGEREKNKVLKRNINPCNIYNTKHPTTLIRKKKLKLPAESNHEKNNSK
jgi:hypothetical protein